MKKKRPWLIPIATLNQGENKLDLELDIEQLGGNEHEVAENPLFEVLEGPVRVELNIARVGLRFLIRGRVRFRARLRCAICGVEFERDYREKLTAEFIDSDDELGISKSDSANLGRELLEGDMLNLAVPVRDSVHLAIPIAPRCRPGCKGICPECGTNLNEKQCDCSHRARERRSPFADLVRLDKHGK